jgi:hypothetical protein
MEESGEGEQYVSIRQARMAAWEKFRAALPEIEGTEEARRAFSDKGSTPPSLDHFGDTAIPCSAYEIASLGALGAALKCLEAEEFDAANTYFSWSLAWEADYEACRAG